MSLLLIYENVPTTAGNVTRFEVLSDGKLFLVKLVVLGLFRENFKMWKKRGKESGRDKNHFF